MREAGGDGPKLCCRRLRSRKKGRKQGTPLPPPVSFTDLCSLLDQAVAEYVQVEAGFRIDVRPSEVRSLFDCARRGGPRLAVSAASHTLRTAN